MNEEILIALYETVDSVRNWSIQIDLDNFLKAALVSFFVSPLRCSIPGYL
jgi:hypothetical protein